MTASWRQHTRSWKRVCWGKEKVTKMKTMSAARLIKPGEPLLIESVEIPEPSPGEVLVEVAACGLCGTDIHLAVDGDIPVQHTPITLGHEAAGTIVSVGQDVSDFAAGDRVALFPAANCGDCEFCRSGRESLCDKSMVYGMARDGALANFIVAPAHSLIRIPDAIPFDLAAIVTDGVSTPFHALRARGKLQAGESVAVVGCGGLGTHAIMIAKMMGAGPIVAIDVQPEALERSLSLGADLAINPLEENPAKKIRSELGISGVNLSLEFVGGEKSVDTALRVLAKTGRAVLVGVGMDRPRLPPLVSFVGKELTILGSFGMDRQDIEDLFSYIASGKLDLSRSVSAKFPLAEVNEALGKLADKNSSVVRVVVEPNS